MLVLLRTHTSWRSADPQQPHLDYSSVGLVHASLGTVGHTIRRGRSLARGYVIHTVPSVTLTSFEPNELANVVSGFPGAMRPLGLTVSCVPAHHPKFCHGASRTTMVLWCETPTPRLERASPPPRPPKEWGTRSRHPTTVLRSLEWSILAAAPRTTDDMSFVSRLQ